MRRSNASLAVGCCAGAAELAILDGTPGLDYVELPVVRALMISAAEFDQLVQDMERSPLTVRAVNVFLPAALKVVGPDARLDQLSEYATTALDRAHRLGVEILVFGSGGSRMVPDGFSHERALDQFEAAVRLVYDLALERGLTLAVEPLHSQETNLLTTLAEGAGFVRQRHLDGVRLLADLWHMECEGEQLDVLDGLDDLVVHAHVAAAERLAPGRAEDHIEAFLRRLLESGYSGACSIECRWSDLAAEAPGAVARVHEAAAAAGWPAE